MHGRWWHEPASCRSARAMASRSMPAPTMAVGRARELLREAEETFVELGSAEAEQARKALAGLPGPLN